MDDKIELVAKAMRDIYNLGMVYWQQADSEYASQHRKSDETRKKAMALIEETRTALAAATTPQGGEALDKAARERNDLALLVGRLIRRMNAARKGDGTAAGDDDLERQAIEYLRRKGLASPLRDDPAPTPQAGASNVPQHLSDEAQILAAERRGNVAEQDFRAWADKVLPLLDWMTFANIAAAPTPQAGEPVAWGMLRRGEIIDCITPAEQARAAVGYPIPLYTADAIRAAVLEERGRCIRAVEAECKPREVTAGWVSSRWQKMGAEHFAIAINAYVRGEDA